MTTKKTISLGDAVAVLMAAKGYTEKTLGEAIKESPQTIRAVIDGKKELSINLAIKLTNVFQTNLTFWMDIVSSNDKPTVKVVKQRKARKPRAKKASSDIKPEVSEDKPKAIRKPRGPNKPKASKLESK